VCVCFCVCVCVFVCVCVYLCVCVCVCMCTRAQLYEKHWAIVRYTVERGATEHELDIFNFKTLDQNLLKLEELLTPVLDLWREFEALAEWKAPLKSGVTVAVCLYIFWNDTLWLLLPGSVVLVAIRTGWAGLKKYSASSTGKKHGASSTGRQTNQPHLAPAHRWQRTRTTDPTTVALTCTTRPQTVSPGTETRCRWARREGEGARGRGSKDFRPVPRRMHRWPRGRR
jgi:hypothetical protein